MAIICQDEQELGLAIFYEIKLGPIHVVDLFRGPLWFSDTVPDDYLSDFAQLFARTFPRRFLRRRRWLPEWKNTQKAREIMEEKGFLPQPNTYETAVIDLTKDEEVLRKNLKQKWRNALNKAEKLDLIVQPDWQLKTLGNFLALYDEDRREKKYRGRSARFVETEIRFAAAFKEAVIIWAATKEDMLAAVLLIMHGNSASYRIGFTTPKGRHCNAHNILLWKSILLLKERGITSFDLGGVEAQGAGGLTKFKKGLGGQLFTSLGMYS